MGSRFSAHRVVAIRPSHVNSCRLTPSFRRRGVRAVGDHLYGVLGNGRSWVDFKTGETTWHDLDIGPAPITYAHDKRFCVVPKGKVSLVKATPDKCKKRSSFSIELLQKKFGHILSSWAMGSLFAMRMTLSSYDLQRR